MTKPIITGELRRKLDTPAMRKFWNRVRPRPKPDWVNEDPWHPPRRLRYAGLGVPMIMNGEIAQDIVNDGIMEDYEFRDGDCPDQL